MEQLLLHRNTAVFQQHWRRKPLHQLHQALSVVSGTSGIWIYLLADCPAFTSLQHQTSDPIPSLNSCSEHVAKFSTKPPPDVLQSQSNKSRSGLSSQIFFRRWWTTLCWDSGSRSSNHRGPEWRPSLSFYLRRQRKSWNQCQAGATPWARTAFSPSSGFFTNVTPCSSNNLQATWTSGTAIPMCPVKCRQTHDEEFAQRSHLTPYFTSSCFESSNKTTNAHHLCSCENRNQTARL